jgi:hypothetical protein
MLRAGMSTAERRELREQYRQRAVAGAEERAARAGLTLRCQRAGDRAAEHRACQGESRGGAGCLCTCHDNPGVTVEEIAS